jgi:hypothetical protein
MKVVILFLLIAALISMEGPWGALIGILGGLGLDIPITLVAGGSFAEIFTGWGLIDDVLMAMLRVGLATTDKFLLGVAIANATHLVEEAYEHYDHTDAQNRRYAAFLARQNPGQTYVYGDVTHKDIFELGISLGLLGTRGSLTTVFEAGKGILADTLGLEVSSDAIAMGAEVV